METFGCSFFVHSDWVSWSNSDAVGVAGMADFCVKTGGRRRRRKRTKRPAIDEGVGSCEDGVMVMTSPLTAKVGLWDTAREEKSQIQHLHATFSHLALKEKKVALSHFKNHFGSLTLKSCRLPALSLAQRSSKRLKKMMHR